MPSAVSVVSGDGRLATDRSSLSSLTSVLVSADVTASRVSSVQDVSVSPMALAALAGADIR